MLDIPTPVINHLLMFMCKERSLAYLLVKKDGGLLMWGGEVAKYGFTNLRQGEKINEQVFFLEGLLPLEQMPLFLPYIKINYGILIDVHMFPSEEGDWVLLLASNWDEKYISLIQQKANHFSLLQEQLSNMANHQEESSILKEFLSIISIAKRQE